MAVINILDQLEQFHLLALVSEKSDLTRYELDPDKSIMVAAWTEDEKEIRNMTIGKIAPSFNHTFVMLNNTPPIYQAKGNLRPVFEKTVAQLRSRQVLAFSPASVCSITLTARGHSDIFTSDMEQNDRKNSARIWQALSGKPLANPKLIEELMLTLSDLHCESFLGQSANEIKNNKTPLWTIYLQNNSESPVTLEIFSDSSPVQAVSSMCPEGFVLTEYLAEQIQAQVYDLLGIEDNGSEKDTATENHETLSQ